jgi:hypothetical protein
MSAVSVSEIHRYPLAPKGVAEPLWTTREWKRSVADHLSASPWLCRASEIKTRRGSGQTAHATDEPVYILVRDRGAFVVRCQSPTATGTSSWRKRRVVEVIDLWREVRSWWSNDSVDRLVVRVLLAGGLVADIAKRRPEEWALVGVMD